MPARKSGISAATLVLSDELGHMIDMPFLTIHLRSRRGQFSVSASDACASLAFARGTAVMLVPLYGKCVSCRVAMRPIGGIHRHAHKEPDPHIRLGTISA